MAQYVFKNVRLERNSDLDNVLDWVNAISRGTRNLGKSLGPRKGFHLIVAL